MELLTLDVVTKEVTMVLHFSPAVVMVCLTGYSYVLIRLELETYLSTWMGIVTKEVTCSLPGRGNGRFSFGAVRDCFTWT